MSWVLSDAIKRNSINIQAISNDNEAKMLRKSPTIYRLFQDEIRIPAHRYTKGNVKQDSCLFGVTLQIWVNIGSSNGLSPNGRQSLYLNQCCIIVSWTIVKINLSVIEQKKIKKMRLKMASAKWRLFSSRLCVKFVVTTLTRQWMYLYVYD